MRSPISLLLVMLVIIALGGCTNEGDITNINEEGYANGRVLGMIHGIVFDAITNDRVAGVAVSTAVNGGIVSTTTNTLGEYALANLPSGDYEITFVAPTVETKAVNYSVSMTDFWVPEIDEWDGTEVPNTANFPFSLEQNIDLYPMTAELTGQLFKQIDDENLEIAAGVTVIADYSGWGISPEMFEVVTDSNGTYLFVNMPTDGDGGSSISIVNLPFNDGTNNYDMDDVGAWPVPGSLVFVDPLVAERTGIDPVVLQNNFMNDDFDPGADLVMTFSGPMDPAQSEIVLWRDFIGGSLVNAAVTWNSDATEATVDPNAPLRVDNQYVVGLDLETTDGVGYYRELWFRTIDGIEFVSSNLESTEGNYNDFPITGDIELVFSLGVDVGNPDTEFELRIDGGPVLHSTATRSTDGTIITVSPTNGLSYGTNYRVTWDAYSALADDHTSGFIGFSTVSAVAALPAIVGHFVMESGHVVGEFDSSVPFAWDAATDVDGFYVYAKNDVDKSDLVLVESFGAWAVDGWVSLPASVFGADPFADGQTVTFIIVGYNDAGEGPDSLPVNVTYTAP